MDVSKSDDRLADCGMAAQRVGHSRIALYMEESEVLKWTAVGDPVGRHITAGPGIGCHRTGGGPCHALWTAGWAWIRYPLARRRASRTGGEPCAYVCIGSHRAAFLRPVFGREHNHPWRRMVELESAGTAALDEDREVRRVAAAVESCRKVKKPALFHPPNPEAPRRFVPRSAATRSATRRIMSVTYADGRELVSAQCLRRDVLCSVRRASKRVRTKPGEWRVPARRGGRVRRRAFSTS